MKVSLSNAPKIINILCLSKPSALIKKKPLFSFQGCLPSATSQLSQHLPVIILILVIVIFIQLLTIIAALCIVCLHSNSCKQQRTVIVRNLNKRSDEESC